MCPDSSGAEVQTQDPDTAVPMLTGDVVGFFCSPGLVKAIMRIQSLASVRPSSQ